MRRAFLNKSASSHPELKIHTNAIAATPNIRASNGSTGSFATKPTTNINPATAPPQKSNQAASSSLWDALCLIMPSLKVEDY
jgi:hypothetical protein